MYVVYLYTNYFGGTVTQKQEKCGSVDAALAVIAKHLGDNVGCVMRVKAQHIEFVSYSDERGEGSTMAIVYLPS
jgi:hypothetical protein